MKYIVSLGTCFVVLTHLPLFDVYYCCSLVRMGDRLKRQSVTGPIHPENYTGKHHSKEGIRITQYVLSNKQRKKNNNKNSTQINNIPYETNVFNVSFCFF